MYYDRRMNLSIRQLATFREVMRSGSISRAARTVGRTQPAVSTMIAALERELGFALFMREHGRLLPTPEARFFLEEAEAILDRLDRARRTLRRVGALERGTLRIACHPAASGLFMPRLLTGFLRDKPEVTLSLIMRSSAVIEDLVASQQFDIGFAETPTRRASIDQTDFDLECVCILRRDDPLARRAEITPAALDGQPMACLFDEHPTARQTAAAFAAAGCRLTKRLELRTFLPGLPFVAEGLCYMICDMITAHDHVVMGAGPPDLVMRPFRPRIANSVSILTPAYTSRSRIAQLFAAHLSGSIDLMQQQMRHHDDQLR
jgi:DNA-binding transcriptional LysR family regulator